MCVVSIVIIIFRDESGKLEQNIHFKP